MLNLSPVNLSPLPSVSLKERSQLPVTPCIYFAYAIATALLGGDA
ncbi:hypothetical protein [Scytonema hofmannii]|nr:hypothetical protein [Scytonema hofmannii]